METTMRVCRRARVRDPLPALRVKVRGLVGRLTLLCAAGRGASGLVRPGARLHPANPHGLAVVIGNRTYAHADVPPVDYAHRDAQAFGRYVVDVLGFDPANVIHLEDATRSEMQKVLGSAEASMNDIQARLNILAPEEGSDVVVYYSGHGVPGKDGGAALLPADVPPHRAQNEGYPLALLYEKLGALRHVKTVSVYLEACFSGSSEGGRLVAAAPVYQEPAFPEAVTDDMMILTAVTKSQLATWDTEAGHGLFTHHLLDALYGAGDRDDDGRVTAREAKAYLDRHMTSSAWLLNEREQNATLTTRALSGLVLASAGAGGGFPPRPGLGDAPARAGVETAPDATVAGGAQPSDSPAPTDPSVIVLASGLRLSDWVTLAEARLERGEHLAVLMEGTEHVRAHGEHASLKAVVERAREGYLKAELAKVRVTDEASARAALEGVEQTRLVLGEGAEAAAAELAALEAQAHVRLGQYPQAEAAYLRWLGAAPAEHPERQRMLLALHEVRRGEVAAASSTPDAPAPSAEEVEGALGLTHGERELVQHGLAWLGHELGRVDGVLGRRSRAALRAYQEGKGLVPTGFLTAELSEALQALGRRQVEKVRAEERERQAEEARRLAAAAPKMVRIEGGCFQMGSPRSESGRDDDERRHRVCVEDFSMGKHEVTFEQWDACVSGGGCGRYRPSDRGWGRGDRPVINVSWRDANAYARWLSKRTGRSYRLPTEAEWEYAARAGSTSAYPWGDRVGRNRANCDGCGSRWDRERTAPVGSFEANRWGLYDTVGNVWEWTCSEYDERYGGAEARCASGSAGRRVIRGGSWLIEPWWVRSAYRTRFGTGVRRRN